MAITKRKAEDVDDCDDYDDGNRNIILSLIGQMRPGSDLSRITLPTFILERKSMLERITNLLQHPNMIIHATSLDNPVERFVQVVRWYMSGWHIAPKAVKKPLNPVLGEYFSCYWDFDDQTRAYYIAEQTSHHAPKSSYFYTYPSRKVRVDGIVIPRSKFLGNSAASIMEGIARLQFGEHQHSNGDETYTLTQPNIYARNVIVGSLKLEIGDKAYVKCEQTNMECIIEFKVKGYITGTYHEIKGSIMHKGQVLYELSGKWNEIIYIKTPKGKKQVFFDCTHDTDIHRPTVRPIPEQGKFESRRLWEKVTNALGERNHKVATDEKYEIEDNQRKLAKLREEGKEPQFEPKLFFPEKSLLQFKICVDAELKKATSAEQTEKILEQLMPILPGDKFPEDFDKPAKEKEPKFKKLAEHLMAPKPDSAAVSAAASTSVSVSGSGSGSGSGSAPRSSSEISVLEKAVGSVKINDDVFEDAKECL